MQIKLAYRIMGAAAILTVNSLVWASEPTVFSSPIEAKHAHHTRHVVQQSPMLKLSASAQIEVRQDWLVVQLHARHQAANSDLVQRQLQVLQDRALSAIRPEVNSELLQLQTGSFRVYPRYGRDGKILHWEGVSEVLIQGRDLPRITRVASSIRDWTVAGMHFELSRQARDQVEQDLTQEAITQFNAKAQALATGFGFKSFELHEVRLNDECQSSMPVLQRMSAVGVPGGQVPPSLSAEPGLSPVSVSLAGAVLLRN